MKDTRVVFYDRYYILKAVQCSEKFHRLKETIHSKIAGLGYPIPSKGFQSSKEYLKWVVPLEKARQDSPSDYAKEILRAFNLKSENELLHGVILILFFDTKTLPIRPTIGFVPEIDRNKGEIQLSLTIFPWTTKEDFDNLEIWKDIEMLRTDNNSQKTKNKEWENFERDLQVFTLYQRAKQDIKLGLQTGLTPHRNLIPKSAYDRLKTYDEFSMLEEKDENLDNEVRSIISRCKQTFGSIQLL